MKKSVLSLCVLFLCLVLFACAISPQEADLWSTATYVEDTELGDGAKTLIVQVVAGEKRITFTIHTDAKTVGEALLKEHLIAGEQSQYGMYVKTVNGILADYAQTQTYWGFNKDGASVPTGVDGETIAEGAIYELVYTK